MSGTSAGGRATRLLSIVALSLLVACGGPTLPAATQPTMGAWASAAAPATAATPSGVGLRTGSIGRQFTTPALEFRSAGSMVIWSTGARASQEADVAPDLFGSAPGGVPVLLYDNPDRDSRLDYIGGDGMQVAFIETNTRALGEGGWSLKYIAGPGAEAQEIDRGVGGQLPFFALSGHRLVWTAVHGTPQESQLLLVDLTTMARRILLSARPERAQYWFPSLDGDRIVYGTVELASDGESDERHVYLIDLGTETSPVRLDGSHFASQPVIRGDDVVWKESEPTLNFLVAGTLVRHSIATGITTPIAMPTTEGLGFTGPSIGEHFVAAWAQSLRDIYVVDLRDNSSLKIIDQGPMTEDPTETVTRAHVAGGLLAYAYGPKAGVLELRWVELPR